MGKDNVFFHLCLLPNIYRNVRTLDSIVSGNFLTLNGEKFSKSRKVGITCSKIIQSGINTDSVRFYLLNLMSYTSDTDMSIQNMKERVSSLLIAKVGNLCYLGFPLSSLLCRHAKK